MERPRPALKRTVVDRQASSCHAALTTGSATGERMTSVLHGRREIVNPPSSSNPDGATNERHRRAFCKPNHCFSGSSASAAQTDTGLKVATSAKRVGRRGPHTPTTAASMITRSVKGARPERHQNERRQDDGHAPPSRAREAEIRPTLTVLYVHARRRTRPRRAGRN